MVQVVPPPDWQPPESQATDLAADELASSDSTEGEGVPSQASAADAEPGTGTTGTLARRALTAAAITGLVALTLLAIWMATRPGQPVAHVASPPAVNADGQPPRAPLAANDAPLAATADPSAAVDDPVTGAAPAAGEPAAPADSTATPPGGGSEADSPSNPATESTGAGSEAGALPVDPQPAPRASDTDPTAAHPPDEPLDPFAGLPPAEPPTRQDPQDEAPPADGSSAQDDSPDEREPQDGERPAEEGEVEEGTALRVPVDVDARLNDPVVGIVAEATPLAEFVQLVRQFSTIPVTLDLQGLRLAGQSAETPVRLSAGPGTLSAVLQQALAPLGLVAQRVADALWITPAALTEPAPTTIEIPAALVAGRDLEELAAVIQRLIEPGTWQAPAGPGQVRVVDQGLQVTHSPRVQAQVRWLLEQLHAAGQARSSPGPQGPAVDASPWLALGGVLAQPITASFFRETPLVEACRYLGRVTQTHALIDELSLGDLGLSEEAPVQFSAQNQPLVNVLDEMAQQLGLAYRPWNPRSIEWTSPESLAGAALECYPLPPGSPADFDTLTGRLQAELGNLGEEAADAPVVWGDGNTKTLVLRATPAVHRRAAQWWQEQTAEPTSP